MSQLGDIGTYPGCAGKTMDDSCYVGVGALATNQRSPRSDRPASAHPPRRASCAVFGNVFDPASTSFFTGTDTAIDLYIENITYYYNWDGGTHHLQNKINGAFAQINLDGPDPIRRGTNAPPHEVTLRFKFVRRDTGQPVSIPWMQFTFFDLDENVLSDWLVNNQNAKEGDGREARPPPLNPPSPPHWTPHPLSK